MIKFHGTDQVFPQQPLPGQPNSFGSPCDFLSILETIGVAERFGFNEQTLFYVESAFAAHWNRALGGGPERNGVELNVYTKPVPDNYFIKGELNIVIEMRYTENGGYEPESVKRPDELVKLEAFEEYHSNRSKIKANTIGIGMARSFIYKGVVTGEKADISDMVFVLTMDSKHPDQYGLRIINCNDLIYQRLPQHNPATEWECNALANNPDAVNATGDMLFINDDYVGPCWRLPSWLRASS